MAVLLFSTASCKKGTSAPNPVDQLPAATAEGKNTFGCLIDGIAFVGPEDYLGATIIWDSITPLYGSLLSSNAYSGSSARQIVMNTSDKHVIQQGTAIEMGGGFLTGHDYYAEAFFHDDTATNYHLYATVYAPSPRGEVKYSKMDLNSRIVSGTFWFDAYETSGRKVEIRDGRFDIKF